MAQRLALPAILLTVILGLGIAGCDTAPPPRPSFPELRFTDKPPIALDVKEIRIEDRYVPPLKAPNVEQFFPLPPADAARRWAQDRLKAVGRFGVARVVIEDASAVSKRLPIDTGFGGLFKREQAEQLTGRLKMRVEVSDIGGFAEADATARRTVPEDVSLNRRDQIYYELTKDLMRELDGTLEAAIRQHLNQVVRSP